MSALWDKLEGWYNQHLPSIAGTLGVGATPEEWDSLMTVHYINTMGEDQREELKC